MFNILLPVDGSAGALRATQGLIDSLGWYKEVPHIDLVAVQLPVHRFHNMGLVVSAEMLQRYYSEESDAMLAPSKTLLDAAGVSYAVHKKVGPVAETIVEQAREASSRMIYMGTRGMNALASMVLGSVAMRVLHLSPVPVVLVQ